MKKVFLVSTLIFCAAAHTTWADVEIPFLMPIPDGWGTETIHFPLGFAPQLEYEGFEELRFAPGMFEPESEDFWTYAFVWWIPSSSIINGEILQRDLEAYYRGLANQPDSPAVQVRINSVEDPAGGSLRFEGTIETIDTFVTQEPVSLTVRVEVLRCDEQNRVGVFFELSPQPTTHSVWTKLHEIRQGFRCDNPAITPSDSLGAP